MQSRAAGRQGVVALVLVSALALSGCLAGGSDTFGPATGGTVTGENAPDNLLALSMRASPARGEAPLRVTFTVKAADVEGPLPWALDFGDGSVARSGSAFPVEVEHTYARPGTYAATFNVTDAGSASRSMLSVTVVPARATETATQTPGSSSSSSASTTTSSASGGGSGMFPPPATTTSSSPASNSSSASKSTTSASASNSTSVSSTTTDASVSSSSSTSDSATTTTDPPTGSSSSSSTDTETAAPPSSSTTTTTDPPTSTSEPTSESSTTTDPPA